MSLYDDVAVKVDEIAERILMLGGHPENRFSEYLKIAALEELAGISCGDQALKNILDSCSYFIAQERQVISLAAAAGDDTTVSMLTAYLEAQEKIVWMLVAYNSGDCR